VNAWTAKCFDPAYQVTLTQTSVSVLQAFAVQVATGSSDKLLKLSSRAATAVDIAHLGADEHEHAVSCRYMSHAGVAHGPVKVAEGRPAPKDPPRHAVPCPVAAQPLI
jgi:hypothetical protein